MPSASRFAAVALIAVLSASGCAMIQGEQSPGEFVDDAALTARVKAALLDNDQVEGTEINVSVYEGKVALAGFADTEAERKAAVEVARQVPGVKSVDSTIRVAGSGDSPQPPQS